MIDSINICNFPNEILQKILSYCPLNSALVNKEFRAGMGALKTTQWNLLKNDEACPEDLRTKMIELEKDLKTTKGGTLFHAIFNGLYKPKKTQLFKDFHCCNLGNSLLATWEADQAGQDYSLLQFWSKISDGLNLENPPATVEEVINWMSVEENQNRLAQIEELDLSELMLTHLPKQIEYFKGLKKLSLEKNKLQTLPNVIGTLTGLKGLYLKSNQFTVFPNIILKLNNLIWLNLGENELKSLPDTLGNLNKLAMLYLANNLLKFLPDSLGSLRGLNRLDLQYNQLEKLPETFGNFPKLESLNLKCNKLGSLPEAFAKIGEKINFSIQGNRLLVVPSCVLQRFEKNLSIIEFVSSRDGKCTSSLEHLCQFIMQNSDLILKAEFPQKEKLGNLVDALEESDRTPLYFKIWEKGWGKNDGDLQWGEKNRFRDMDLFIWVIQELLYSKDTK